LWSADTFVSVIMSPSNAVNFLERNLKLEAKDVLPNINRTQAAKRAENSGFVPVDLDLQTRPSERPNTSSV